MTLYRQTEHGEWEHVFEVMQTDLEYLLKGAKNIK